MADDRRCGPRCRRDHRSERDAPPAWSSDPTRAHAAQGRSHQASRHPRHHAARTLLDLAAAAAHRELERALAEAFALRLTHSNEIRAMLARHPRRPGSLRLAAMLDAGQPAYTRSEAEERLLALIDKARLERPETNTEVAGHQVDFFWPRERLVVEVDGFAFHASRQAFERDRRRDADVAAAGGRVMRVTWRQLVDEPEAFLVRLARSLAHAQR